MGAPPAVLTAPPQGPLLVHKSDQGDQPEPRAQCELGPSLGDPGSREQTLGSPPERPANPNRRHPDADENSGLAEHAEAAAVKSRRCWGCEGAQKAPAPGGRKPAARPQHGGPSQGPALPKRLALGSRLSAPPHSREKPTHSLPLAPCWL